MATTTTHTCAVTLAAKGGKLVLRSRKDERASDFYQTLPAGRWDQSALAWTCDAMPSAAWRVLNQCPLAVEADEAVMRLAAAFASSLDVLHEGQQPACRKTDGWRHQVDAFHFAGAKAGALLAHGMGVGKSWVAVQLIVNRRAQTTLILCPLSVLGVWRREIDKHAGADIAVLVLDKGTVAKKAADAEKFLDAMRRANRPAVIVVNYETAKLGPFAMWSKLVTWDAVVCDESHRIKAHDSQVSKYAADVGKQAAWRLCLSGTPMPNGPLDLFGQYRFLDRGIFGSSFHHFRNRYAKLNQMFPGKVDAWINQDEFRERFALLAHRVTADEVLDLPEAIHIERRVTLGPKAKEIYESLRDDLIADIGAGVVTATNALVRLLRLQQATSGYAVADESREEIQIDSAKAFALMELLEDIGPAEPVVVLCVFKHDLATVRKLAESLGLAYGEVSGARKDGVNERGQMPEGLQVVGVQIRAGGLGIDLTRARYCVLFSVGFSLGDYDQALARVHRPGQTRTTYYYHLIASGTVDEAVYQALANKREVVEEVLSVLKA